MCGQKSAERLAAALCESSAVDVPVTYEDGTTASEKLARKRWAGKVVIFWPFELEVFRSSESDSPIKPVYAGRVHCPGQVSVVSRDQFIELCDSVKCQLARCDKATAAFLITPQPVLLGEACCRKPTHCVGMEELRTAYSYCSDVRSLQTVAQRWLVENQLQSIIALCPHLELLKKSGVNLNEGWLTPLRAAMSGDPVRFSPASNVTLAEAVVDKILEVLSPSVIEDPPPAERARFGRNPSTGAVYIRRDPVAEAEVQFNGFSVFRDSQRILRE